MLFLSLKVELPTNVVFKNSLKIVPFVFRVHDGPKPGTRDCKKKIKDYFIGNPIAYRTAPFKKKL